MPDLPEALQDLFGPTHEPAHDYDVYMEAEIDLREFDGVEFVDRDDPTRLRVILSATVSADSAQQIDMGRMWQNCIKVTVQEMRTKQKHRRKPTPQRVKDQGI